MLVKLSIRQNKNLNDETEIMTKVGFEMSRMEPPLETHAAKGTS